MPLPWQTQCLGYNRFPLDISLKSFSCSELQLNIIITCFFHHHSHLSDELWNHSPEWTPGFCRRVQNRPNWFFYFVATRSRSFFTALWIDNALVMHCTNVSAWVFTNSQFSNWQPSPFFPLYLEISSKCNKKIFVHSVALVTSSTENFTVYPVCCCIEEGVQSLPIERLFFCWLKR